ncbi:MAG: M3 family oligoendopeptidase [bacterium]
MKVEDPEFLDVEAFEERSFVPDEFEVDTWPDIEPLFDQLIERAGDASNVEELESVVVDHSELESIIGEERGRRYIKMTCFTDNEDYEDKYLHFVEELEPKIKQARQDLEEAIVSCEYFEELPDGYDVYCRTVQNNVELFQEENVQIEAEVSKISQKYQKLSGQLSVEFDGEEKTLQEMRTYLEKTDRDLRERAWRTSRKERYDHREEFDEIFDNLHEKRQRIADNAGFDSFRDYTFRKLERFDYTPEDCFDFHSAVKEHLLPVKRELQSYRREYLELDRLRPWDTSVNILGKPPIQAYETEQELIDRVVNILENVRPEYGERLRLLEDRGMLDLENRKGKAPGGYQTCLWEARIPFIFMNGVGVHNDIRTLLHESGHALHTLESRDQPIMQYRSTTAEFAEVASMTMELIGCEYYDDIYTSDKARQARIEQIETIIGLFPWVARVDEFQHELYKRNPSAGVRRDIWTELADDYSDEVDWEGLEKFKEYSWHRQLHVFEYPFYYIEYGIAQLGAVRLWRRYEQDPRQALDDYERALELGGARPLPELFEAANIPFDFSAESVQPLSEFLQNKIDQWLG